MYDYKPKLSKRLETVVSFVSPCNCAADVGTDHGFVPISLALDNVISHGIAMDINEGPLSKAREHISEFDLGSVIETRNSDGLSGLKSGEADTVIITGMGGELMIRIMDGGRLLWDDVTDWILSPQSKLYEVRTFLCGNGFEICREAMIEEDSKFYTIMDVRRGKSLLFSPWEMMYGPCLIRDKDPVLMRYLEREHDLTSGIINDLKSTDTGRAKERIAELERQLGYIEEAYHEMQ